MAGLRTFEVVANAMRLEINGPDSAITRVQVDGTAYPGDRLSPAFSGATRIEQFDGIAPHLALSRDLVSIGLPLAHPHDHAFWQLISQHISEGDECTIKCSVETPGEREDGGVEMFKLRAWSWVLQTSIGELSD